MTRLPRIFSLLAISAACLGVSACGDDDTGDPIPSGKARQLERHLDAIQQSVDDGCVSVAAELREAQRIVASLDDDGVGEDVQDAISNGIENLRTVAARECAAKLDEEETTPETTPETVPTTPETVPTTPEPTTPEPTTPEPTTPEPLPPEEEPDEGDGGAQFEPDKLPPGQAKKDGEE